MRSILLNAAFRENVRGARGERSPARKADCSECLFFHTNYASSNLISFSTSNELIVSLLQYKSLSTAQPTSAITWDDEKRVLQTVIAAHECKEVAFQLATPINAPTHRGNQGIYHFCRFDQPGEGRALCVTSI